MLLAAVVVIVSVLWALQRHLIFFPSTSAVPPAGTVLPSAQDVVLHTEDDLRLGAWLVPAEEPSRGMTVLVANGNAGNRADRAPLAAALASQGLAVLLFDYRGYGGNPGTPSGEGLARDARAAYRFLVEEAGISPDRIVSFGESLGAAVVARLAAEHPPGGLVLRSPFVDLASVGKVHYPFLPVRALLRDRFPVVDHLRDVSAPVVVVYGERDSIVPPAQSRAVAEAAPQLLDVIEVGGADHNDPSLLDGKELIDSVVAVADHIEQRP